MSMWTLMHVNGCGGPCWRENRKPSMTDPIVAEGSFHLDGTPCQPTDPLICETCGAALLGLDELAPENYVEEQP